MSSVTQINVQLNARLEYLGASVPIALNAKGDALHTGYIQKTSMGNVQKIVTSKKKDAEYAGG